MIPVAAVTSGVHLPSTRFRVRQHIEPLRGFGFEVREFCPMVDKYAPIPFFDGRVNRRAILPIYGAWMGVKLATRIPAIIGSYAHHITWLGREFLPGYPTLEGLLKRPLVLDVDDAIWLTTPFGEAAVRRIARLADAVIAGNRYLADWFAPYAKKIHVIPTAVDADRFRPGKDTKRNSGKFCVGWTGSASTLPFLEAIEEPLHRFLSDFPDAELRVMAERPVSFKKIPPDKWLFEPWSPQKEAAFLEGLDVGLMPVPNTKLGKGKCAFKMLLYMSAEVPVIGSPVGMNREVLSLGNCGFTALEASDWYEALAFLYRHEDQAHAMGKTGRRVVLRYFDRFVVTASIADVFRGVL